MSDQQVTAPTTVEREPRRGLMSRVWPGAPRALPRALRRRLVPRRQMPALPVLGQPNALEPARLVIRLEDLL